MGWSQCLNDTRQLSGYTKGFYQSAVFMTRFWSAVTKGLSPYVPGEQPRVPDLIKLNTNEHALAPSPKALQAIADQAGDALRRYPDPNGSNLVQAIAELEGLSPENVFVGNGSDEILAHAFQGLLTSADVLITPDITYSFYPVWANLYGLEHCKVPLSQDFSVDIAGLCRTDGAVLLANPNAPTGMTVELQELERLISSKSERLVVIDEAYFGFGAASASQLLGSHQNLLITRSLSKSHALAGLRVGYALGSRDLIEGLRRIKDSFNSYPLDALAQVGAEAALRDTDWLNEASRLIIENRAFVSEKLEGLGFVVCPSQANFVFAQHPNISGKLLFDRLRERNILVRRWDYPRIDNHLRITIGTRDQCTMLVEAFSEMV